MNVSNLWHSPDERVWNQALQRYWSFVQPRNLELERRLDKLELERIRLLDARGWFDFLHDEYFRWKYTAPNRYATTTRQMEIYLNGSGLDELDRIRQHLLTVDAGDVRGALVAARQIRGLGIAGASGLLSLMFPECFATLDQFVVRALMQVRDLPEDNALATMNPESLRLGDGVLLTEILRRKAKQNNVIFGTSAWTPRKIDMVLWGSRN
jgi:hypothetical protein